MASIKGTFHTPYTVTILCDDPSHYHPEYPSFEFVARRYCRSDKILVIGEDGKEVLVHKNEPTTGAWSILKEKDKMKLAKTAIKLPVVLPNDKEKAKRTAVCIAGDTKSESYSVISLTEVKVLRGKENAKPALVTKTDEDEDWELVSADFT